MRRNIIYTAYTGPNLINYHFEDLLTFFRFMESFQSPHSHNSYRKVFNDHLAGFSFGFSIRPAA